MRTLSAPRGDEEFEDGARVGRYLLLRDADGVRHALSGSAVLCLSEVEDGGTALALPGGRVMRVAASLSRVLGWLDGRA